MKYFLILLIIVSPVIGHTQSIKISNSTSETLIRPTDFLEVGVKINEDVNCCDYIKFEGHLTRVFPDSLQFYFQKSTIWQDLNSRTSLLENPEYWSDTSLKTIAKSDIGYLTQYKSEKNRKFRDAFIGIGGLVAIGGALTGINALIFTDGESRNNLLIASVIQLGVGLTVGLSSSKRSMRFKEIEDPWQF